MVKENGVRRETEKTQEENGIDAQAGRKAEVRKGG